MKPPVRERLSAELMEEVCKHAIINCVVKRKFDPYPRTVALLRPLFNARDAADRMLAAVVERSRKKLISGQIGLCGR
jgi:hypothetical protein